MQGLKWFFNTGEVLLKIGHPTPKLHTTYLFLSSLPSLSYNSLGIWGLGVQSYKLPQQGQGGASAAEAQSSVIFMYFRLNLLHLVQYK